MVYNLPKKSHQKSTPYKKDTLNKILIFISIDSAEWKNMYAISIQFINTEIPTGFTNKEMPGATLILMGATSTLTGTT
ncbi:21104_t:CDS:2 [Rhizophagus irregularis]|nr:21104_t:CDS:2 [Rhizophagus irregularis]